MISRGFIEVILMSFSLFLVDCSPVSLESIEQKNDGNAYPELIKYANDDILQLEENTHRTKRFTTKVIRKWPFGLVFYVIDANFNKYDLGMIHSAILEFHKRTCIKFIKYRGNEKNYLNITSENLGCKSQVGLIGGSQNINLQVPICTAYKGRILHELMHAIGFYHEHNRPDRDEYVDIQWDNIDPEFQSQFEKLDSHSINYYEALDLPYDYDSVMHYDPCAYSINGNFTIIPKNADTTIIGDYRDSFSSTDIKKINKLYCS